MAIVLVTGASGLIGSEAVKFFAGKGFDVAGIDNNFRQYFFGKEGSTLWARKRIENTLKSYTHHDIDIRDKDKINGFFKRHSKDIHIILHAAAQPSHDWAAKEPMTDFSINAMGTLILLEAAREYCPDAVFIFTSTNKVYGDRPNTLPFVELPSRWELDKTHPFHAHGIDESMSVDQSKHSVFGASKVAADVLVQEYGRYFGMKTGVFRCGCLTGPFHSGVELHGFLSYLVKCAMLNKTYTIFGYQGKQVRDNIHSKDFIEAMWHFSQNPKQGSVYNLGGSRFSHCSILEAIDIIETVSGKKLNYDVSPQARSGDHIWWVSDVRKFQKDYPQWRYAYDIKKMIEEMVEFYPHP